VTATSAGRVVEPPLTGNAGGAWHAVGWIWPANPHYAGTVAGLEQGEALCGLWVDPVPKFGAFEPDLWAESLCHTCGWLRAIRTRTVAAWLARLGAKPGRALAVAVAEAILVDARRDGDTDECDVEDVVDLLAAVSAHAGVPLIALDCAEGSCGHTPGECPTVGLACHACSVPDPSEDHRYRPEATVAPPCSTLLTLARAYGITATSAADSADAAHLLPQSGAPDPTDRDVIDRTGGPS
jgi:hypothetical protein